MRGSYTQLCFTENAVAFADNDLLYIKSVLPFYRAAWKWYNKMKMKGISIAATQGIADC